MLNGFKNIKNIFGSTFSTSRASGEFLLLKTDYGTVHVEGDIIRRIVERTRVEGVNEVRNIIVNLPTDNYPLQIRFSLIIDQNCSAPVIGANLRDAIKEELKNFLNIVDVQFDIRVAQINQIVPPEKKKRRVR
jgi:uncharacterized alkaline shock family protein YloU